jgi:hypothetical protein
MAVAQVLNVVYLGDVRHVIQYRRSPQTENGIGDNGAQSIGIALKINTTLTELNLESECQCEQNAHIP